MRLDIEAAISRKCTCTQVSPFMVRIDGYGDPIPAVRIPEQTWTVGDTGRAIFDPPAHPLCVRTTR